jgi:prepilin-type N-terminal cleavage/methylation domain-containing protein
MIYHKRESKPGFTLIELMVVLFIIGILSAVTFSYMRGRVDSSKWSEGRSAAGSIRTAARAYCAERGPAYNYIGTSLCDLGFDLTTCPTHVAGNPSDLDGKYFSEDCYSITFSGYDNYLITVDATKSTTGNAPATPSSVTLSRKGKFVEN